MRVFTLQGVIAKSKLNWSQIKKIRKEIKSNNVRESIREISISKEDYINKICLHVEIVQCTYLSLFDIEGSLI